MIPVQGSLGVAASAQGPEASQEEIEARVQRILSFVEKCFSSDVLDSVRSCDLRQKSGRVMAAQIVCCKNHWYIESVLEEFGIEDQASRIEIAERITERDPSRVFRHIREFGIQDQAALIRIAKIYVASSDSQYNQLCSDEIQKLGIQDQAGLIEIAELLAEQCPNHFSYTVQKFGIRDQAALIRIANIWAKRASHKNVPYHIQNFGIQDQAALIELAKIWAKRASPWDIAYHIQHFGIRDQAALIEFAKMSLRDRDSSLPLIKNLGLQDDSLVEVIKTHINTRDESREGKTARSDLVMSVMQKVQDFGLKSEAAMIELVEACALLNGDHVANYFQRSGIQDQTARVKIGKICAANAEYDDFLNSVRNFGIESQPALVEIVKIYAARRPYATISDVTSCNIQDRKGLADIYFLCMAHDPYILHRLGNHAAGVPFDKILGKFSSIFSEGLDGPWKQPAAEAALGDYIHAYLPGCGFEWVLPYLAAIQDPHAQKTVTVSIAAALFYLRKRLTDEQLILANQHRLFWAIYEMRSPHLYLPFIGHVAQFCDRENGVQIARELLPLDLEGYRPFLKLLRVMLAELVDQGVQIEAITALLDGKSYKTFKDVRKSKLLLNVLRNLVDSPLPARVKNEVLHKLTPALYEGAMALSIIFGLKADSLLEDPSKSLDELALQAALAVLPLSDVEDFSARFAETFGKSRAPEAIWQYVADQRGNPVMLKAIATFMRSVLMGTYAEERYQTVHMQQILPEEIALWRTEIVLNEVQTSEQEPVDAFKWMQEKIISHGHMKDLSNFPHLEKFLSSRICPAEEKPLEKAFIEFTYTRTVQSQETALLAILHALREERIQCEFVNDVTGLLQNFQRKELKANLRGVDTDDPDHFVLCGSEVPGSCQRIGGDPELNKGLMGYPGHGQNRLLSILDSNNRIQARSILRLTLDQDNKRVLFVEEHYGDRRLESAVLELAKRKARQMRLPLTTHYVRNGENYESNLHSLGGPMPFEYCDATRSITENGVFTIYRPYIVPT